MPNDVEPALPGFAEFLHTVADRAGADDLTDGTKYTAEFVIAQYPGTYKSAVRALFFYKLPVRTVADLFRMSKQTVAAIRNQVLAHGSTNGAAAFFTKTRVCSQREIILSQLVDTIEERLSDPEQLKDMSTSFLVDLVERLTNVPPASNKTDDDVSAHQNQGDINIIEADQFDEILNGLSVEKNPARVGCSNDSQDHESNDPRGTSETANRSMLLSNSAIDSIERDEVLSNSLSKSASNGASDENSAAHQSPGAPPEKGIPGGAGVPGCARGRGVT